MADVENRVVRMGFDNEKFMRGIAPVLDGLSKLKDGLGKLSGAAKGLGDFKVNSQGVAPLGHGVDALITKFSALQVAGVAAIANIANKAVNAGTNIANSLTIAPISGGLGEYEKKMQSIQTVLSNTAAAGTTLDQVSAALNELNLYSDKTIYNFGEMAKNVGTFTAAGVDLETAVGSIKGIANLAALSGSSSEQASTAMYQLSQAISAGKVSLMDWNSVVNAGMGGSIFQRSLAETAVAMGKLPESALKLEGAMKNVKINGQSFRESISAEGGGPTWLTSDVLTKALGHFTGDLTQAQLVAEGFSAAQADAIIAQGKMATSAATRVKTATQLMSTLKESAESGWASTWELIIGDFNEAPVLFTKISDKIGGMIQSSAEARNKVLGDWKMDNGRHFFLVGLKNAFTALESVIKPITQAFRDIFPATTGKQLADLSERFMNFTQGLILGKDKMENLRRTFRGLFAVINIVVQVVKGVIGAFFGLFDGAQAGGGGILAMTAIIGDFLYGLQRILTYKDPIGKFFDVIAFIVFKPLVALVQIIGNLASAISLLVQGDLSGFKERFNSAFEPMGAVFDGIKVKIEGFWQAISGTFESLATYLEGMARKIGAGGNLAGAGIISGLAGAATFLKNFFTDARGTIDGVVEKFNSATTSGKGFLAGFGGEGLANLRYVITAINDKLVEFREKLNFSSHFDKFNAGAGSTASGGVSALSTAIGFLSKVWDFMSGLVSGLAGFFGPFLASLGDFFSQITVKIKNYILNMDMQDVLALVNVATFGALYLAIAGFFKKMGGAASGAKGMFDNIGGTFTTLKDTLSSLQSAVKANIIMQIAIAVGVLVAALFILAKIDAAALGIALGALGVVFGEIAAMMKLMKKIDPESMIGASLGLVAIATAVVILAGAIAILGAMDPKVLIQGGLAIASIMGALAGMAKLMSMAPGIFITASALVVLSVALVMMAGAIALYSVIPFETMKSGLEKMAATLIVLAVAMSAFGKGGRLVLQAAAITILAKALVILAAVITVFGLLPMDVVVQGILAMGAALIVLAIGAAAMNGSLIGAAAMVIMAGAISALVPAIALLGALPMDVIVKGLAAIAAIMLIFVAAMYLITPVIVTMALFSSSLLTLGLAMLAAGAGFALFVGALAALTLVGAAGFGVLTAGIITLLQLLPIMAQQFGYAIIVLAQVIGGAAPKVAEAAGNVVMAFINEIARRIPEIALAGLDMLLGILKAIRSRIGEITNVAIDIVVIFIDTLRGRLPEIIQQGVDFILSFVEGLAKAIRGEKERTGEAGSDLAMAIIDGMVSGMSKFGDRVNEAIRKAARDLVESFKDFLGINSPSKVFDGLGGDIIMGLIQGIGKSIGKLGSKVMEAGSAAIKVVRGFLPDWANTGIDFITNIISGVGKTAGKLGTKAREAVTGAIAAAKEMDASEIGSAIVSGMVKGISGGLSLVTNAAKNLAKGALDAAKGLLGIHSPSKEFEKVGNFVHQGFRKGLVSGSRETATTTYNSMKEMLGTAMKAAREDISQHEDRLKKLTSARVKDSVAINKTRADLAQSRRELVLTTAAHKELTTAYVDEQRRITKLSDDYTNLTKKLEDAQKVLDDAIKTRDDYAKSVKDQYDDLGDVTADTKILTEAEKLAETTKENAAAKDLAAKASERAANATERENAAAEKIAKLREDAQDPNLSDYERGVKSRAAEREAAAIQRELKAQADADVAAAAKEAADAEAARTAAAASVKEKVGVQEYIADLNAKAEEIKKFSTLLQQLREQGLNDAVYEDLLAKGVDAMPFMEKLAAMGSGAVAELNAASTAMQTEAKKLGDKASKALYDAGVASAQGIVNGIKSKQSTVIKEMEALATAMLAAIKKKLGIKSPSREFAKLGGFASRGMAEGIKSGVGEVQSASEFMANKSLRAMQSTMDRLSAGLSAEMDLNPTIAPILDLSAMQKESSKIGKVLGRQAISVDASYSAASAVSDSYKSRLDAMAAAASSDRAVEEKQFIFNQVNNSPKALSPAEIYRNTKNQLSVARGALV